VKRPASPPLRPIKGRTLREIAYEELRNAMLAGHFEPGQLITIREIAALLKCGVMPAREGVQQLASQGAFEFLPNRSFRVPVHTLEELQKIFEARALLECYAAERAAGTLKPSQVRTLRRLLARLAVADEALDASQAISTNYRFHFMIYEACRSPYIVDAIDRLWLRIGPLHLRVFQSNRSDQHEFFSVLPQHAELVDAVEAGNGPRASIILRALLTQSLAWYEVHAFQEAPARGAEQPQAARPAGSRTARV
jgi:DNA-binding GntR family transcriptional regulator